MESVMIKGIGTDIVEISRIAALIAKRGETFLQRVFTPEELVHCGRAAHRLAGRFAAKEAFFKALGTGFRGFKWHEVQVCNGDLGAPYFSFPAPAGLPASARGGQDPSFDCP